MAKHGGLSGYVVYETEAGDFEAWWSQVDSCMIQVDKVEWQGLSVRERLPSHFMDAISDLAAQDFRGEL